MAELREVKQRIQTTREIRKVTNALQMIASVQLHQHRGKAAGSNLYAEKLAALLNIVASRVESLEHPLLRAPEGTRAGLVVFGSDRGLCGAFNSELVRAARTFVEAHPGLRVRAVGRVVARRLARLKLADLEAMSQPSGKTVAASLDTIVRDVSRWFSAGEVASVHVLFQRFESVLDMEPVVVQVLPLTALPTTAEQHHTVLDERLGWANVEPDPHSLADWLIPEWMNRLVHNAFLNSLLSEAASRQRAMSRASENAETMIGDLSMRYRRLRQESITEEMLELSGGALA